MKKLFKSKEITIVVVAIVIVFAASTYIYFDKMYWINIVATSGGYVEYWEESTTAIRDSYNEMFKGIWTVAVLVFGSAFLLLKAIRSVSK